MFDVVFGFLSISFEEIYANRCLLVINLITADNQLFAKQIINIQNTILLNYNIFGLFCTSLQCFL